MEVTDGDVFETTEMMDVSVEWDLCLCGVTRSGRIGVNFTPTETTKYGYSREHCGMKLDRAARKLAPSGKTSISENSGCRKVIIRSRSESLLFQRTIKPIMNLSTSRNHLHLLTTVRARRQ